MSDNCFFNLDGDVYLGRDPARGPWSADLCHAGPVAAAMARSVERAFGSSKDLVRLTIDLIRPIPMSGFTVSTKITRNGRRLANARARLMTTKGKVCATATAMLIAPAGPVPFPTMSVSPLSPEDADAGHFPVREARHDLPIFGNLVEIRYPKGQNPDPGPTALWMRTPRLLADEEPTSFQRLCPLADCGNAIARNGEIQSTSFVNSDLTIVAHRKTHAEWLLADAVSHWHENGIGISEARISDQLGPIATALQSLILEPT